MSPPADSLGGHWSLRLPARLRALALLSRLDRPVGWRLLLLPCLMGLGLARMGEPFRWGDLGLAGAFLVGAIAARGAGCTFNDIIDRDVDAQVARTRGRPLPAGLISLRGAWAWLAAQVLMGLLVLLALPPPAALVSLCAVPLVGAYPFMKRITWWPQAWLGLCFSWGALVAAAALGGLGLSALLLYLGCTAWVIAYDTIYALQDVEDDALVGVRSTARRFGARWKAGAGLFYALAAVFWLGAVTAAGAPWWVALGMALLGLAPLLWLHRLEPAGALGFFRANAPFGLALAAWLALEPALRMLL